MEHSRNRKRGAIELSMTTIIVVVIGVTLLTLGLRWIYSIFGGLGEQQTQLQKLTEEQILALFGESESAINMPQTLVQLTQGDRTNLRILVRNIHEETHSFNYGVMVDNATANSQLIQSKLIWYKSPMILKSGEGFQDYISFYSKGLPLGVYRFRVELSCLDCGVEEKDSIPLIIEVTAGK